MSLEVTRQFDIPYTTGFVFTIPDHVKGRLTKDEYVFFNILDIDPRNYQLVVESFNGDLRRVGPLQEKMRLPHVRFTNDAFLLISPTKSILPTFIGILERGKKYTISLRNNTHKQFILLN